MNLEFFGVLNVTPDSFSDGGQYLTLEPALRQAEALSVGGCSVIDIGADSTRPGSACVGIEAEWMRIKDILPELCKKYSVSIDTHHAAIARKAIDCGAKFVNDVSSGSDPEMFPLIASSRVNYVLTFTCCSLPHLFDKKMETDIIGEIKTFFKLKIDKLLQLGVNQDRIILDS
jgi:dihydropteroate synthase